MNKLGVFPGLLLGLLFTSVNIVYAQSIKVTPTFPTLTVQKTVQFSAQVTGLSNTTVTWSAGGVKGGNATAGTISSTGLYKAPAALPGQNPVQITATSVANSKVYASTFAYILAQGPTITSVSPDPLSVGSITVTIQGTGLQQGAEVYQSYGSNVNIQMVTDSVTATTVTASGYQGAATSATFSVKNPGSDFSNSITIPVSGGPPPTTYTLNVVNGTGSGTYTAGTVVTITANAPPAGQAFTDWTGATVQSATATTTTLTMPAANATVSANYTVPGGYALTVVNGTGSGTYTAGTVVTITANAPPAGQAFTDWTGATVQSATS